VGHPPASAAPKSSTAMIVDRMKFFGDIFYPILGDSSQCASVGWRAEMYRLVSSGTTTIFMPRILARFETSSVIIAAGYQ
jgi:hypothetical protein